MPTQRHTPLHTPMPTPLHTPPPLSAFRRPGPPFMPGAYGFNMHTSFQPRVVPVFVPDPNRSADAMRNYKQGFKDAYAAGFEACLSDLERRPFHSRLGSDSDSSGRGHHYHPRKPDKQRPRPKGDAGIRIHDTGRPERTSSESSRANKPSFFGKLIGRKSKGGRKPTREPKKRPRPSHHDESDSEPFEWAPAGRWRSMPSLAPLPDPRMFRRTSSAATIPVFRDPYGPFPPLPQPMSPGRVPIGLLDVSFMWLS